MECITNIQWQSYNKATGPVSRSDFMLYKALVETVVTTATNVFLQDSKQAHEALQELQEKNDALQRRLEQAFSQQKQVQESSQEFQQENDALRRQLEQANLIKEEADSAEDQVTPDEHYTDMISRDNRGPIREPKLRVVNSYSGERNDDHTSKETQWLYENMPDKMRQMAVDTYFMRASVQETLKDWPTMEACGTYALELAAIFNYPPLDGRCHFIRGIAFFHQRRWAEAAESFVLARPCEGIYMPTGEIDDWLQKTNAAADDPFAETPPTTNRETFRAQYTNELDTRAAALEWETIDGIASRSWPRDTRPGLRRATSSSPSSATSLSPDIAFARVPSSGTTSPTLVASRSTTPTSLSPTRSQDQRLSSELSAQRMVRLRQRAVVMGRSVEVVVEVEVDVDDLYEGDGGRVRGRRRGRVGGQGWGYSQWD